MTETPAVLLTIGLVLLVMLAGLWVGSRCDRYNVADWGGKWLNRLDGLNRMFCRHFHRLAADPVSLPERGGVIVAANHISGLDPLLMVAACARPLRFMIATEQYNRWWLRWLFRLMGCIPVNRSHRPEKAFYSARQALDRGEVIAVFPQGRIQLPSEPAARLKPGIVFLAGLAEVPVVPLHVSGVRGVGRVILAVVLRSRARVQAGAPVTVAHKRSEECLERINHFILNGNGD
ncbi:MAG: 1-acyl-sn-glycerol-3-phosphate acyltransferase [Gammaproteobacteria bacterium]|nr:1-acyl-sn-glycerol-3-phosphate acyltransferase [Gammaproteobacteria bacterium]